MRITRLEAQNIGAFEHLVVDFKPKQLQDKAEIHILTGENGTGKSTILLMLASYTGKDNDELLMQRFRFQDNGLDVPSKIRSKFNIYFDTVESSFHSYAKVRSNDNKSATFFSDIRVNKNRFNTYINSRFSHCFGYSGFREIITNNYLSIKEVTVNPLEKAIDFKKIIDFDTILNWIATNKAKAAFAELKGNKSKTDELSFTIKKIEEVISAIIQENILFVIEDQPFQVFLQLRNQTLDFNVLPDGLKSIISWLSDLLMRLDRINWEDKSISILDQNFVLFLDEIEVHLHPAWQRKILPVVQGLFPNAQIFISTHSPFVVGSVDGAWVYKFKLDEQGNSVLDGEPVLTEDGNSYDRILEEIFGVKERFGVDIEAKLDRFYDYKNQIINNENFDNEAFNKLLKDLENQSDEVRSIVGFEMRQIERKTKKQLETA